MEILINTDELFLNSCNLFEPLSKEEMVELFKKVKYCSQARNKLIEHNIRLVFHQVLKHFRYVEYDKKDLISIGNIGLIKAIDTYDVSKNIRFATYAIKCINNEINQFLRKIKKDKKIDSLEKVITIDKKGNKFLLQDIISSDQDVEEEYINIDIYQIVSNLVDKLPDKEKEIVMLYFGFYNNTPYNQRIIAEKFNYAQSYISKIIKRTLIKLAIELEFRGIIENSKILQLRKTENVN